MKDVYMSKLDERINNRKNKKIKLALLTINKKINKIYSKLYI